jgi:predicted permease
MLKLIRRLRYFLRQGPAEAELREEMELHRALKQEHLEASGALSHEAALASRCALGNTTLAREDARAVWIWPWFESIWQDVVYALRSLRREPAFTLVALVALGGAIGLNTSLFTTFNAFMWRSWPVRDPHRIVTLVDQNTRATFSLAERDHFARYSRTLSGFIATRCLDGLSEGCSLKLDDADVSVDFVTPNYFNVLGIGMSRGAGFTDHMNAAAAEPIAIISDRAWRARFGSAPDIVGRAIALDDIRFTIVGVAAPGFKGTTLDQKDLWIPIAAMPLLRPDHIFDDVKRTAAVSGRLSDGVTVEQARAELDALSRQFRADRGLSLVDVQLIEPTFFPNPSKRRNADGVFKLMLVAVLLVLALACANVGNLLLARSTARRREIAARLALGASRRRVVRQLLTESLLLSLAACFVGMCVAFVLPQALLARLAGQPLAIPLNPDAGILSFGLAIAMIACLAFGLAPALHASRAEISTALRERSAIPGTRIPLRALLLALQIAISIVLLVSGGLIVRGVRQATVQDPGFDIRSVSVVSFELPASFETARARSFALQVLANAPTVMPDRSLGFADVGPFMQADGMWTTARIPGAGRTRDDDAVMLEVSAGYFDALAIPIVAGRNFGPSDSKRDVILISESMAKRLWPNGSAVGRPILVGDSPKRATSQTGERQIIGVVKDANTYYGNVTSAFPTVYAPIAGRTVPRVIVRHLDPGLTQALAALAQRIEPRARLVVTTVSDSLDRRLAPSVVAAWAAGVLGLLAATLAGIGVFSVFAYAVEQRTAEVGIRLALGARPSQIVYALLASNSGSVVLGGTFGVAGALAASQVLRNQLHGLSPFDPIAYAGVAAVLTMIALAATVVPARRATRIDPIAALRCE